MPFLLNDNPEKRENKKKSEKLITFFKTVWWNGRIDD